MSYISLSGNIAVGKSTVLSGLEERGYNVVYENLKPEFMGLLADYNKDPSTAIHLQNFINDYRFADAKKSSLIQEELYIHERSMIDDMIFTTQMMGRGDIDQGAWTKFLEEAHRRLDICPPSKVIYLYADPETTYNRMVARGRSEESGQTLMSIAELEQTHQLLLPLICEEIGAELVEVDWTEFGEIDSIINLI
jgi:deoxyadenosine/deoxycytidine kinase